MARPRNRRTGNPPATQRRPRIPATVLDPFIGSGTYRSRSPAARTPRHRPRPATPTTWPSPPNGWPVLRCRTGHRAMTRAAAGRRARRQHPSPSRRRRPRRRCWSAAAVAPWGRRARWRNATETTRATWPTLGGIPGGMPWRIRPADNSGQSTMQCEPPGASGSLYERCTQPSPTA